MSQTWSHQPPAIEFFADHPYAVLDAAMGTGKSFILIQHLLRFGITGTRRSLIVCPEKVMGVWRGQFHEHAPGQFDVVVLDGSGNSASKSKKVTEALVRLSAGGPPLVVVVNYETMWRPIIYPVLTSQVWEVIAADEIHKIKSCSIKAKASMFLWKLGMRAKRRGGLTGTLLPHSPMDAFAQYRFLDDTIFGRYITHFRKRYAVMNQYVPQQVDEWINQAEMQRKLNIIRFVIPKSVLVLPDKQDIVIECPLSAKGMKVYQEMKRECIALVRRQTENVPSGRGQEDDIRTIVAGNGAVQFLRLLQLAQGYSKDDEGVEVDTDTEKRKMLLELLEQTDEPVCVYGYFRHDMKIVEDCAAILGRRYGEISGTRKDLTPHGKFPEDVDVLAVQVKSGSSGIDLTRARIAIMLNTGTISPGDCDQVIARQHRPGQTRNLVYYWLVTPRTVDITIQKARQERRDVIEAILNGLLNEEEDVF